MLSCSCIGQFPLSGGAPLLLVQSVHVDAPVEEVKEKSEEEKRADAIRERINRERLEAQKETQKRKTMWAT